MQRLYIRFAVTDNVFLHFLCGLLNENRRSLISSLMEDDRVCAIRIVFTFPMNNYRRCRLGICQIDGERFTGLSWRTIYSDCIA